MAPPMHPQIPEGVDAAEEYGGCWPPDRPFPLTAGECVALVMGFAVKPQAPMTQQDMDCLPGAWEGSPSTRLVLHRK